MPILPTTVESSGTGMAEPTAVAGVIAMLVSDDGAFIPVLRSASTAERTPEV